MTPRSLAGAVVPLAFTIAIAAQAPAPVTTRLTFEVAAIRRNLDSDPGGSVRIDAGNRLMVSNISLAGLVRHAYGAQRWEMVPGANLPSWMQTERWNIQAKAAPEATREQVTEMFRNLRLTWTREQPSSADGGAGDPPSMFTPFRISWDCDWNLAQRRSRYS